MIQKFEIVLKPTKRVLSLFGCMHNRDANRTLWDSINLFQSLLNSQPSAFLVECNPKSLDLSRFVWKSRSESLTHELFCEQESGFVETSAIAAADKLGLDVDTTIFPIDSDSFQTRKRLALKLLFHPIESLTMISKYHGSVSVDGNLDAIRDWRKDFESSCPTSYGILFTDREAYMREQILSILPKLTGNIAVVVGASHLEALYELLLDST